MTFKLFGVQVKIEFMFTAIVALLAVIDTQGVMWMSLSAVAIHELGHIAAMLMMKIKIRQIRLCCCGILIRGDCCSDLKISRIVAAAGPAANILPAYFSHGTFKYIMLLTGIFNLIPIFGTDGGDIAKMLCMTVSGEHKGHIVFSVISAVSSLIVFIIGVLMFVNFKNPTLLAAATYFCIMTVASVL